MKFRNQKSELFICVAIVNSDCSFRCQCHASCWSDIKLCTIQVYASYPGVMYRYEYKNAIQEETRSSNACSSNLGAWRALPSRAEATVLACDCCLMIHVSDSLRIRAQQICDEIYTNGLKLPSTHCQSCFVNNQARKTLKNEAHLRTFFLLNLKKKEA
ncbi:hypothetical protein BaRGS_00022182 [Batillaria attramentaria]|uniref:Uncharacterized protein n=1 Tax=Batillaria attramentaria TaxID=370345 RepID=A0ABD0KHW4_9CAEN